MLPKKLKLQIADFPKTAKTAVRDGRLTLRLAPNGLTFNRLGVTFRSKSFKTSVLRNRLKRGVFNFFSRSQEFRSKRPPGGGRDILITLNPDIIEELKGKDLKEILKKYDKFI